MPHDPAPAPPHESSAPTAVRWLIGLNVAVYFLQLTVVSAADVRGALGFEMRDVGAWWTVGTYLFVHPSTALLALNMFSLWRFGPHLEQRWGTAQFAGYYLVCGIGAWVFYLLFAQQGLLVGSSGAVLGVMLAYAAWWPDEEVLVLGFAPLNVRWLVAALMVLNIALGVANDSVPTASHFVHLGGLAAGWLYVRLARSMDTDRFKPRVALVADEPDDAPPRAIPPRATPRQRAERDLREVDDIVQQSRAATARQTTDAPRRHGGRAAAGTSTSGELNALLDKISAQGLDALTQTERDRLEEAARKLRDK